MDRLHFFLVIVLTLVTFYAFHISTKYFLIYKMAWEVIDNESSYNFDCKQLMEKELLEQF